MSLPRVCITLGHTGQVVERGGTGSNSRELRYGTGTQSGRKRTMGDAFRIYPDGSSVKRQRENGSCLGAHENGVHGNEMVLTAGDLRLKLMHRRSKSIRCGLKEVGSTGHLHENLAKSAQASASDSRFIPRPEPKERFHPMNMSYTHNAGQIRQVDSMQKRNASWILNEVGTRPPDSLLKTSRGIIPPTNYDGLQQFPSERATFVSNADPFVRNGVFDTSRSDGFSPTAFKSTVENAKPVMKLAPMSGIVEKSSHGEVPLSVSGLLHSLGLGKYEIAFRAEEVDLTALKQMGDKDLKDLGIPMGPRKKILLALMRLQNMKRHMMSVSLGVNNFKAVP